MVGQTEMAEAVCDPVQTFAGWMRAAWMRIRRAYDFAQQGKRGIGQVIFSQDRVERDILTLMTELATRNVEHHGIVDLRPVSVVWKEKKLGCRIDKMLDQPGTRDPVDFNFFTGNPFHTSGRKIEITADAACTRFFINHS